MTTFVPNPRLPADPLSAGLQLSDRPRPEPATEGAGMTRESYLEAIKAATGHAFACKACALPALGRDWARCPNGRQLAVELDRHIPLLSGGRR